MNRRLLFLCVSAVGLMAAGHLVLVYLRTHQRLGQPAVKIVNVPLITESNRLAKATSVYLPERIPGYQSTFASITERELMILPADTSFGRRTYRSTDGTFTSQASVVLMGTDRTSIHQPEFCLNSQGWNIQRKTIEKIHVTQPRSYDLAVRRFDAHATIEVSGGKSVSRGAVYVFWFVADGQRTASHWTRNWWIVRDLLFRNVLQRWAYVSYFADCAPGDEDATFEKMTRLISASAPAILQGVGEEE
ncbi:MAG TPA: exosortase-associated EpsI family protein [Candidatus Limnocylindria bacterium]|jgi:hypothetical protein|nr:exosortase-associated EpsI family protein [Candidatus Limnocylindria bacterium]